MESDGHCRVHKSPHLVLILNQINSRLIALITEGSSTSEKSANIYQTIRHKNPEDGIFTMMFFFWVLAPCRLVGRCQRSEKLQHRIWRQFVSPTRWHVSTSLHGAKLQKNHIILNAVKTTNLTDKSRLPHNLFI
jgi:hypothetical protein